MLRWPVGEAAPGLRNSSWSSGACCLSVYPVLPRYVGICVLHGYTRTHTHLSTLTVTCTRLRRFDGSCPQILIISISVSMSVSVFNECLCLRRCL
jgi:hypothetical protein